MKIGTEIFALIVVDCKNNDMIKESNCTECNEAILLTEADQKAGLTTCSDECEAGMDIVTRACQSIRTRKPNQSIKSTE